MGTYCGKSKDFTFFSNLIFENNKKIVLCQRVRILQKWKRDKQEKTKENKDAETQEKTLNSKRSIRLVKYKEMSNQINIYKIEAAEFDDECI